MTPLIPWVGALTALILVLALASSRRPSIDSARVDCKEDLDCYVARARECLPAVVTHKGHYPLDWNKPGSEVPMSIKYEILGRVQGRCHVSRIQLSPAWDWPDAGARPVGDTWEVQRWEHRQRVPFSTELGIHAPLMQCLYPDTQAAQAVERLRNGSATLQDMKPCYPGDGRCGTLPRFVVGCVARECLLGRWTFVCDAEGELRVCEGTRLSDNTPWEKRCASWCGEDGEETLDCDFFWPDRRRAKVLREAQQQRVPAWGRSEDADAGMTP